MITVVAVGNLEAVLKSACAKRDLVSEKGELLDLGDAGLRVHADAVIGSVAVSHQLPVKAVVIFKDLFFVPANRHRRQEGKLVGVSP